MPLRVRLGLLVRVAAGGHAGDCSRRSCTSSCSPTCRAMDAQLGCRPPSEQQVHLGPDDSSARRTSPRAPGPPALKSAQAPGLAPGARRARAGDRHSNPGLRGALVPRCVPCRRTPATIVLVSRAPTPTPARARPPDRRAEAADRQIQVAAGLAPLRATMANVLQLLALAGPWCAPPTSVIGWGCRAGRSPRWTHHPRARTIARPARSASGCDGARHDEVGQLATAFNAMIERLDESARRQLAFLADTSHELRSPLTVLRGNLDLFDATLIRGARVPGGADAEARRMARLVATCCCWPNPTPASPFEPARGSRGPRASGVRAGADARPGPAMELARACTPRCWETPTG